MMARPKKSKTKLRRAGVGALPLLAGLMMASGLVRLGDGTGSMIAREFGAIAAGASTSLDADEDAPEDEVAVILAALQEREAQLDERETRLVARERQLTEVETRIKAQLAELDQAEADLADLLKLAAEASETDLTRLTAVYEAMKPQEAARVFTEMEPVFAAGFLGRMRPEAAAQVMSGLDPQIAYSISVMIAGRNATVGNDG